MPNILTMDVATVPLERVTPYPGNARQGDITAIADSLAVNGQYRPLVVQRSTGHVLCGNNTLAAAHTLGWTEIAVQYIDVNDDRARRILLADNRTNDAATYDDQLLAELLTDLEDLDGTGFDPDEVDDLLAQLTSADPAPLAPFPPADPTPSPARDEPQGTTQDEPEPEPGQEPQEETPDPDRPEPHNPPPPAPEPVAEMILAFTPADRNEAAHLIAAARDALGQDTKTADIVLRALRTLVTATDARHNPDATLTVSELLRAHQ